MTIEISPSSSQSAWGRAKLSGWHQIPVEIAIQIFRLTLPEEDSEYYYHHYYSDYPDYALYARDGRV